MYYSGPRYHSFDFDCFDNLQSMFHSGLPLEPWLKLGSVLHRLEKVAHGPMAPNCTAVKFATLRLFS
jgi:hypothetical protein